MIESEACALEYLDKDATQQICLFISLIDKFFNCLNSKSLKMALLKRKAGIAPYTKVSDYRLKVNMS